jgi:Flp pilus assembly protein TadG
MSRRRAPHGDRGAVTALELVLVAPVLLALMAFALFCGRLGRTAHTVRALAAAAARAASIERSEAAAAAAAARTVGLPANGDLQCRAPAVSFGSDGTVATVTVRVSCSVALSGLALLPLTGTHTFTSAATEPIDRYRGD